MSSNKKKIEFEEAAVIQINESIAYYNEQQKGLGRKFEQEINQTVKRIQDNPYQFQKLVENEELRRAFTKKFSFKIVYLIEKIIRILNIFHTSKNYIEKKKE